MQVQFTPAYAYNDEASSTAPQRIKLKLALAKKIVGTGDFKALVTYGIGVSRKSETRIMTMANKHGVVIDFIV